MTCGCDENAIIVWDTVVRKRIGAFHTHTSVVHAIAWSPDGTYLASAGDDKTVQLIDTKQWSPVYTYLGHQNSWWVRTLSWSPDSHFIASGDHDGNIHVWEV